MNINLEVTPLRTLTTKPPTFEGVSLDLATDQRLGEESSLLNAIVTALRPLTTLVRRQSDER